MKSTIWIDLTDMVTWTGSHGGTQRVVYGIAEEFYLHEHEREVKYCVFDDKSKAFYLFDFQIIRRRVRSVADHIENGAGSELSRKARVKYLAHRYLPRSLVESQEFRVAAKRGIAVVKRVMHKGRSLTLQAQQMFADSKRGTRSSATSEPISFTSNDTVLLLGKPWDTPRMLTVLLQKKQQHHFKVGILLYDMIISLYPHLHASALFRPYTKYAFEAAQLADVIFPISQSTAEDYKKFCNELHLDTPTTSVIRIGDVLERITPRPISALKGERFILTVGTIEVRKNHALLYYVYKLAAERLITLPRLIIVGRPGWNATDIYNLIKSDKTVAERISVYESVSDAELSWLYQNCLYTVYPSMYEGWGLPVAESLGYGKYCIASHASSIPEIGGSLLDYFSPYSADECLTLILKYLDDRTRLEAEKRISERYQETTWNETYVSLRAEL